MTSASPTVRSRGPYRTGVRRREQIIGAATAVFAEYGYAGGSVRTIADRIGVSPASLLQHFGSKEGLLMAVLEDWDRHTVEAQLTDVTGLDYFRRLPEVMAANVSNRGLLELFTTMAAEASSPTHPAHAFIQRRYTDNLATLAGHLQQAVDAGDVGGAHPGRDRPSKSASSPPSSTASGCNGSSTPAPTSSPAPRPTSTAPSPDGARLARPGCGVTCEKPSPHTVVRMTVGIRLTYKAATMVSSRSLRDLALGYACRCSGAKSGVSENGR